MKTTDTHVYFWKGQFSNWANTPFTYEGNKFVNSEQAFMWCKAKHFNDEETAAKILAQPDPEKVKALGREVKGYNDDVWNGVRASYMFDVCLAKFANNSVLKVKLLNTGDRMLVEASPFDKIWGVGLAEEDPLILDEKNWKGQNLLGKVLVDVRRHLF